MDMLVKELKGFFDEKNNKEPVLIDIADFLILMILCHL